MRAPIQPLLLALALSHFAATLPQRQPIPRPERSTGENGRIGGIYMCTSPAYTGVCSYAIYPMTTCTPLLPPFLGNITSFGPDQYAGDESFKFDCSIYDGDACTGVRTIERWPGNPRMGLGAIIGQENTGRGRSVRCDFWDATGLETYNAWKAQGYDFDKYVEREGKCDSFCD